MAKARRRVICEGNATCLTIVEFGAELELHELSPNLLDRVDAHQHAAVVQQPDEPPWGFAVRVARRVRQIASSGASLRLAVLVTNGRTGSPSTAARWWIACAIVPVVRRSAGQFIVRAPDDVSPSCRSALFALAGRFVAEPPDSSVSVSVQFQPKLPLRGMAPTGPAPASLV